MGNGHPIGGVVTTPEIAQRFAATGVSYFNTVRNHNHPLLVMFGINSLAGIQLVWQLLKQY